jgi:transposase
MDRAKAIRIAEALNEAIWLRDNVDNMSYQETLEAVKSIVRHQVFSSRQISAIANGKISHSTVSRVAHKSNKTGGNLNVGTLDILRNILYNRANGSTDYNLIASAVGEGTSQNMVSKITGVSQSSISKKMKGMK